MRRLTVWKIFRVELIIVGIFFCGVVLSDFFIYKTFVIERDIVDVSQERGLPMLRKSALHDASEKIRMRELFLQGAASSSVTQGTRPLIHNPF